MTGTPPDTGHRRYGLYYPYFHVRDERWLKAAALYWPRIIRIVPEDYPTRDSETVRVLTGELGFVESAPPGESVKAVAPRLLELVTLHSAELRERFGVPPDAARLLGDRAAAAAGRYTGQWGRRLGAVHRDQMAPDVIDALVDAGLACHGRLDLSAEVDLAWVVMNERMVSLYTSLLAEHFSAVNRLDLTTDQPDAFAITNDWSAECMAAALLDTPAPGADTPVTESALSQRLALLALGLVVPADLDRVPVQKIVELRRRHGQEFLEFGRAVDQAAEELIGLTEISDQRTLQRYLEDEVDNRFRLPLEDLRRRLRDIHLETATMAVNVKLQLPAALTLAGGAWLAGQPMVAGTTAAALGLLTIRQTARHRKEEILRSAGPASFLLHTQGALQEARLLKRTLRRLRRIASTPG